MYQPIILCIGLRYILKKKITQLDQCIAYFSIFTISFGVMALITVLSVMNGFEKKLEKRLLNFIPHILLTQKTGSINYQNNKTPPIKKIKNIKRIHTIVTSDVILQSYENIAVGTILGINPNDFEPLSNFIISGSITQLIPNAYHIIIGSTLAESLKVKINDNIRLILPNITKITPIGNIPAQRIFKIIGIYITNTDADSYQILINQKDGAQLMHYPSGHITGWRIWLKEPMKVDYFFKKEKLPNNIVKKDWTERHGSIFKTIQIEKNMMGLLLSLIILMSGCNIISFSCLLITEKKKEIAILKTQGLSNKRIILLFTIQGTSIGIIGTIFGILFGYFLTKNINYLISFFEIFQNEITLPTQFKIKQIIIISITTILISFIATLYPAKIAATIKPSKILQHE